MLYYFHGYLILKQSIFFSQKLFFSPFEWNLDFNPNTDYERLSRSEHNFSLRQINILNQIHLQDDAGNNQTRTILTSQDPSCLCHCKECIVSINPLQDHVTSKPSCHGPLINIGWDDGYGNRNNFNWIMDVSHNYLCSGSSLRAGAAAGWWGPGGGRGGPGYRPHGDTLPHGPGHGRRDGRLLHHVNSQYNVQIICPIWVNKMCIFTN